MRRHSKKNFIVIIRSEGQVAQRFLGLNENLLQEPDVYTTTLGHPVRNAPPITLKIEMHQILKNNITTNCYRYNAKALCG